MKNFFYVFIVLLVLIAVYFMSPLKNISILGNDGSFEGILDSTAKEISSNQNLSSSAIFTVSDFVNPLNENNKYDKLIESEIRNSLAQAMPNKVTSYRILPAKGDIKALLTKLSANDAKSETAEAKSDTPVHYLVSGTYKQQEQEIIISLFISDADNGRGYYAKRISLAAETISLSNVNVPAQGNADSPKTISVEDQGKNNAAVKSETLFPSDNNSPLQENSLNNNTEKTSVKDSNVPAIMNDLSIPDEPI